MNIPPPQTVTINEGESILVRLPQNPSTGYSWEISTSPGLIISQNYLESVNSVPGAPNYQVWILTATKKGPATFKAYYRRPWEPALLTDTNYTLIVNAI